MISYALVLDTSHILEGGLGFLLVKDGGREWLSIYRSSCTCGMRGLIRGRWSGGGLLVLDLVGPIMDLPLFSFFPGGWLLEFTCILGVGRRLSA